MREKIMRLQEKFRTPRLLLTRVGQDDFKDMLGMYRDAQVAQALGRVRPESEIAALVEKLAQQWDTHGFGWWTVRDPASGRFMGRGGLRQVTIDNAPEVEVGYTLLPEFWNRGFATELARVSVAQGFVRLALAEVGVLRCRECGSPGSWRKPVCATSARSRTPGCSTCCIA
jgi:ribosomal-protein-alanine N-acetyltransferase